MDVRFKRPGIKSRKLQPEQTEGSNKRLTLTEASARSREQHEATIEWNLLSDVQLRKETADRTEMALSQLRDQLYSPTGAINIPSI